MSRILVVEPRNILRQAIGLALFPDHEVQMAAWLSDSHATVAQEFDLVIVDAAASRATNTLNSQLIRAVQSWKVPTKWSQWRRRNPGRLWRLRGRGNKSLSLLMS